MKPYTHKVQYYETDRMGVTHHSNYIRWMEEARMDFLEQIGWPYERFEAEGFGSPVVEVSCKYKKTTTFADEITIAVHIKEMNEIKLVLEYHMKKKGCEQEVCTGTSSHCFLNADNQVIRIKRVYPAFYESIMAVKAQQDQKN